MLSARRCRPRMCLPWLPTMWRTTSSGYGPARAACPGRTPAIDISVSPRTLHEIYLEPFRRALAGQGVASFMGSYNRVSGEYVCQSRDLLALPRARSRAGPGRVCPTSDSVGGRVRVPSGLLIPRRSHNGRLRHPARDKPRTEVVADDRWETMTPEGPLGTPAPGDPAQQAERANV